MSNCKVIALTNQKGGVGKTTTAVNLGVSLVQQGKKVLLIDADAQANLTMALGYNRPDDIPITLSTVMQNIIDDKTLDVSQGIIHHSEGVDLLPSNIELSGFEVRLINAMSRERVLKTYVNEVKKNYDYVLIDCMPSLGMITINALAAADSVIIPTQPHYLSAKGLELLLRSVSMVKRQINPKLRIDGILMTTMSEITYSRQGDYLIPDLTLPTEPELPLGRYALMHRDYLEKHKRVTYLNLLTSGRLNGHLHEVEQTALQRLELLTKQLSAEQGVTEELKEKAPMQWVGLMNNIRSQAEEVILTELIYK